MKGGIPVQQARGRVRRISRAGQTGRAEDSYHSTCASGRGPMEVGVVVGCWGRRLYLAMRQGLVAAARQAVARSRAQNPLLRDVAVPSARAVWGAWRINGAWGAALVEPKAPKACRLTGALFCAARPLEPRCPSRRPSRFLRPSTSALHASQPILLLVQHPPLRLLLLLVLLLLRHLARPAPAATSGFQCGSSPSGSTHPAYPASISCLLTQQLLHARQSSLFLSPEPSTNN